MPTDCILFCSCQSRASTRTSSDASATSASIRSTMALCCTAGDSQHHAKVSESHVFRRQVEHHLTRIALSFTFRLLVMSQCLQSLAHPSQCIRLHSLAFMIFLLLSTINTVGILLPPSVLTIIAGKIQHTLHRSFPPWTSEIINTS